MLTKSTTLALCIVLLTASPALAAGKWTTSTEKDVVVKSARGQTKLTFSVTHPSGWERQQARETYRYIEPGKPTIGLTVMPIHKEDSGAEQLLNEPGGLRKWLARVQPQLKILGADKAKIAKQDTEILRLRGDMRGTEHLMLVTHIRVGDVNIVMIASCEWKDGKKKTADYKKVLSSFTATAG